MKNPQNLFKSKIKKIKKNILELEENLFKLKKYDRFDNKRITKSMKAKNIKTKNYYLKNILI